MCQTTLGMMAEGSTKRSTRLSDFHNQSPIVYILPDEMLHHVCAVLATDNPRLLLPVCLVDRRLQRIASPLLVYSWRHGRHTNASVFVQHLHHHPEVRREIRQLKLRSVITEYVWKTHLPPIQSWSRPTVDWSEKDPVVEEVSSSLKDSDSLVRQL
ncbi:hypothetical protein BKA67DRAFT_85505 [Truncatella angustata]|uniref:F-box domain-containing protein n=1 Tax=Truncatella angustata TaxID=152316 RepID=A0A9P8U908_9PEZI|nr:uncharacterized protein BKA67DRAFT_85505 [Truncatella angustata]KAH6645769.1 hypothetical protein BKA67DRAFT_85505 [Truncatella angustata]